MGKTADDYRDDYTEPELRARLKEEIKASDRGGRAGQWSARKSQLLTTEYEKAGGGYRHPGERTGAQRDLERWTEQDWRTESGGDRARHGDGTERYLPAAAWEELSPEERERTQDAKRAASADGRQRAENPDAARAAREAAEVGTMTAAEAVKAARHLSPDAARRALHQEQGGKDRKTVVRALERAADG